MRFPYCNCPVHLPVLFKKLFFQSGGTLVDDWTPDVIRLVAALGVINLGLIRVSQKPLTFADDGKGWGSLFSTIFEDNMSKVWVF